MLKIMVLQALYGTEQPSDAQCRASHLTGRGGHTVLLQYGDFAVLQPTNNMIESLERTRHSGRRDHDGCGRSLWVRYRGRNSCAVLPCHGFAHGVRPMRNCVASALENNAAVIGRQP
ncbi:hypothetical protein [Mesorhizobium sp. M0118]|uniref:hypothetical protein n=1 Tax=Mesorhizobium sp. M0118 TaxID=2956884 RepID=UPI00333ABF0D